MDEQLLPFVHSQRVVDLLFPDDVYLQASFNLVEQPLCLPELFSLNVSELVEEHVQAVVVLLHKSMLVCMREILLGKSLKQNSRLLYPNNNKKKTFLSSFFCSFLA